MSLDMNIGFLGAGKMATALAKGFIQAGLVKPQHIQASDPVPAARQAFAQDVGAKTAGTNLEVVRFAQVLVLAVKPDQVTEVLSEIQESFAEKQLLISIAAGVTLARMEQVLGDAARIVRVMPNTPALVGASATAFALGKAAQPEDETIVSKLFSATGVVFRVKERMLDAVTGLSGSGPAYVFLIIEALSDGGVAAGLPREVATKLAAQTVFGSAKMVIETGLHPGVLKDMVTSPGGTTIEGLSRLEQAGVRGAFIDAVRAASDRAGALGRA